MTHWGHQPKGDVPDRSMTRSLGQQGHYESSTNMEDPLEEHCPRWDYREVLSSLNIHSWCALDQRTDLQLLLRNSSSNLMRKRPLSNTTIRVRWRTDGLECGVQEKECVCPKCDERSWQASPEGWRVQLLRTYKPHSGTRIKVAFNQAEHISSEFPSHQNINPLN